MFSPKINYILVSFVNLEMLYLLILILYSAVVFNEDLTWEKTTTYNLGIDFDLFKNNFLSGSFDIYRRETTDLLARVPLPPGQGLSDTFIKNVGSTESKGFELGLNFKLIQTENFTFEIPTNIAYTHAKVTDLKDVEKISAGEVEILFDMNKSYYAKRDTYSLEIFFQLA